VDDLRPSRVITGALIWEVYGQANREKADALAEKLQEVYRDRDNVRVSRPMKSVKIRITGLDDSVTSKNAEEELAKKCERPPSDFKVGDVKRMTSRLGSCWVRCPVDADKMLMAAQRITVEWSSCKMALLPAHGLQCYKYLEAGNVQSKCTSPVDRSGCCYRCGAVDHKAKECCSVRLDCPACGTLCWLSSHCIVGPGCTAPGKKMKKGAKPSGPPAKAADRRDLVRARFAPFNRRSEKERMHTNLSLRNLDMVEYAQLLITITHYR